jgi:hypothetical protein
MKTLRIISVILAISVCQFARSQAQSDIQILQATYGAGSQQIDVTEKIQSRVQSGQTNVQVESHLFGPDPAFGKRKTLSVDYSVNSVQHHIDIREHNQLSLVTSDNRQSNTVSQTSATSIPAGPMFAPEGTYFLTASTSISKKETGTLIGLQPGTAIQALRDDGATIHAKWENFEFDIDKRILTNDLGVARTAANANYQAELGSVNAFNNAQQQELSRQMQAMQKRAGKTHRERSTGENVTRNSNPNYMRGIGDTDEARELREKREQRMEQDRSIRSQIETLGILRGNHTLLTPKEQQLQNQIDRLNRQRNGF